MATGTRYEPERIKMLADAVFAIAMTILVLDLKIPSSDEVHSQAGLLHALREDLGVYGAYVLSFYVLGLIWLGHVRLFRHVEAADEWLFRASLFLLLFAGTLPFPTALIGNYGSYSWAVVLYAACMILLETSLALQWWHCNRKGLLVDTLEPGYVRSTVARYLGMITVFLVSIPVAFVAPNAAEFVWLLLGPVPALFVRAAQPRAAQPPVAR